MCPEINRYENYGPFPKAGRSSMAKAGNGKRNATRGAVRPGKRNNGERENGSRRD
jgi:hypothetical protein